MEHQEFTCHACSKALNGQSYRIRAYQLVGTKVTTDFRYNFCHDCSFVVRSTVRQALVNAFMQMLADEFGKFRQKLQATGLKIGKHL